MKLVKYLESRDLCDIKPWDAARPRGSLYHINPSFKVFNSSMNDRTAQALCHVVKGVLAKHGNSVRDIVDYMQTYDGIAVISLILES